MIQASIAVLDCSIFNNPLRPMYAYQSRGERRGPTISEPGLATRRPLCLMLKRLEPSAITQKAWFFYISLSCPNLTQFWLKPARKCVQILSLVPVNRRFSNFFLCLFMFILIFWKSFLESRMPFFSLHVTSRCWKWPEIIRKTPGKFSTLWWWWLNHPNIILKSMKDKYIVQPLFGNYKSSQTQVAGLGETLTFYIYE